MLWLYLLGIVTVLGIVIRRLVRRQKPLSDEAYSSRVAIDNVNSGVAWIPANGTVQVMNPALAQMVGATEKEMSGRNWLQMFAEADRPRVELIYSQMLLAGRASLSAATVDSRGVETPREILLVAVDDHKMRFMGHHCIIERIFDSSLETAHLESARVTVSAPEFATLSS